MDLEFQPWFPNSKLSDNPSYKDYSYLNIGANIKTNVLMGLGNILMAYRLYLRSVECNKENKNTKAQAMQLHCWRL